MSNTIAMTAKPFDLPPINNHLEALAEYLGVESDLISDNGVYQQCPTKEVRLFRCPNNELYVVAGRSVGICADVRVWYNSNFWDILKHDSQAGTKIFTDEVVTDKLSSLIGEGKTVHSLEQASETFEIKNQSGLIEVWKYRSHHPEDLASYYLVGLVYVKLSTYHPKNSLGVVLSWDHNKRLTRAQYNDGESVELNDALRAYFQLDIDKFVLTNN